jgi:hypothetical protein
MTKEKIAKRVRRVRRKGNLRLPFIQMDSSLPLCRDSSHDYGWLLEYKSLYIIKTCKICSHIIYKDEIILRNHISRLSSPVASRKSESLNSHLSLFEYC